MQKDIEQMRELELNIRKSLSEFQEYYVRVSQRKSSSNVNNSLILPKFIKIISDSTKPIQYFSQMLTDSDILNLAATCHTMYKLIFSPLGFRLSRHLRPIVVIKKPGQDNCIPQFSKNTVDQLCIDRNMEDADEDDKDAILLTMQTNILATKQKVRQLDLLIQHYDKNSEKIRSKIMYLGGQREQYLRKCIEVQEEVEKLREVMKETEGHAESLRQAQAKIYEQRQNKLLTLNQQKTKLSRQKELLIKKIKSQQKQKEEGLVYAREVNRILNRLSQITGTGSKPSHKSSDLE